MADSPFMRAPWCHYGASKSIWSQNANRIKGGLTLWRVVTLALDSRPGVLATLRCQNCAGGRDLDFQMARSYSLRRPLRTGQRLIRS